MSRYSPQQAAVVDRDARNMATGQQGVLPLSTEIDDLWSAIDSGTISITSAGADVDSMCLGGGEFTQDTATASGGSLLFAWLGGRFHNGLSLVTVAAGSLTLAASATNYIQVSRAGVVTANTTGFTSGQLPLWTVATGAGTWLQANVVSQKPHLCLIGANGVSGAMLSAAAQTKELNSQLGAVAATATWLVPAPNIAAVLNAAVFAESVAVAANDTNYWTWAVTNLGQAGVGMTAMLAATSANTTKATGGSALVANGPRSLALHGTPGVDANLNTQPNDVLQVTLTATGAPTALAQAALRLDFAFTG